MSPTRIDLDGSVETMTREEFENLTLSYIEEISAFARRLCRTAWDADELIQDTYERAFDCWSDLREPGRCRAWMFRIARNLHLDRGRSVTARPELRLVKASDSLAPEPSVPAESVARATANELEGALSRIADDQREAVLLADLWGFTYEEIAEILGVPVGTVRSRISRGRMAIMRVLADENSMVSSERVS